MGVGVSKLKDTGTVTVTFGEEMNGSTSADRPENEAQRDAES
jgi:hypothetical protein